MKKIAAGKYLAKVADYSIRRTQAGKPEPIVRFRWMDKSNEEFQWNWRGSLNEGKAREITLKTLVLCGLTTNNLENLCDGPESCTLNLDQSVSITVELEVGQDGKEYPVIKWVNDPSATQGFKDEMSKEEAAQKFNEMGIVADLLRLRSEMKSPSKQQAQVEIPF